MKKSEHYDIRDNVHRWIRSFLTDRTQQVLVEGATSDSIYTSHKWSASGNSLVTTVVSSIYKRPPRQRPVKYSAFCRCILYRRIKNQRDCDILQDDLDKLASWEKKWVCPFTQTSVAPSEYQGKQECKDQESIQSSTTPDPGYQWESDKLTVDTTNESQEVSPFPAGDHKAHINRRAQNIANTRQNKNIKDPQKKYRLGTVSKIFYWRA